MTPFYEMPVQSTIADKLFDFAATTGKWEPYYNFHAVQVPFELAYSDPVLYMENYILKTELSVSLF